MKILIIKEENKFSNADNFINFLLNFLTKNKSKEDKFMLKPMEYPKENEKYIKTLSVKKLENNNNKKKMDNKNNKQIKTLNKLKILASEDLAECHIRLNGGLNSSKQIQFNKGVDDYGSKVSYIKGSVFCDRLSHVVVKLK